MVESASKTIVTAAVIVIGNEILSGRTVDANLGFLARRLGELGVRLREARVIPDETAAIVAAVNEARGAYDYVITTGGIGPTHDDITTDAVAEAFGVGVAIDDTARARLEARYERGRLNEARLRMARIPKGSELIDNPISGAPGFRLGNVLVLAGIPAVMQAMFESAAHALHGGARLLSSTLTAPLMEGDIAAGLGAIQRRHEAVEIGSYPYYREGRYGLSIVLRSTDARDLAKAANAVRALMRGLGAEPKELS
jgi:molybdenum cofactor synthesis domain-containing protein